MCISLSLPLGINPVEMREAPSRNRTSIEQPSVFSMCFLNVREPVDLPVIKSPFSERMMKQEHSGKSGRSPLEK